MYLASVAWFLIATEVAEGAVSGHVDEMCGRS